MPEPQPRRSPVCESSSTYMTLRPKKGLYLLPAVRDMAKRMIMSFPVADEWLIRTRCSTIPRGSQCYEGPAVVRAPELKVRQI